MSFSNAAIDNPKLTPTPTLRKKLTESTRQSINALILDKVSQDFILYYRDGYRRLDQLKCESS